MGCCLSKTEENQDKMFDPNTCPNEFVPKKELQEKSTTRFEEVSTIDMVEFPKEFMTCTACGYVTDLKKIRKNQ